MLHAAWRAAKLEDAKRANAPYRDVPAGRTVLVKVDDFWLTHVRGSWVVAWRLVVQDGRLVIGELRVYPKVERAPGFGALPPWNDARDLQGVHAWAPPGGLTATVVHRIATARVLDVGRLILSGLRGKDSALWKRLLAVGVQTEHGPASHRTGGPAGKSLAFYRAVAKVYLAAPKNRAQAVAKALGIPTTTARSAVHRARHRYGLLPLTSRGKR